MSLGHDGDSTAGRRAQQQPGSILQALQGQQAPPRRGMRVPAGWGKGVLAAAVLGLAGTAAWLAATAPADAPRLAALADQPQRDVAPVADTAPTPSADVEPSAMAQPVAGAVAAATPTQPAPPDASAPAPTPAAPADRPAPAPAMPPPAPLPAPLPALLPAPFPAPLPVQPARAAQPPQTAAAVVASRQPAKPAAAAPRPATARSSAATPGADAGAGSNADADVELVTALMAHMGGNASVAATASAPATRTVARAAKPRPTTIAELVRSCSSRPKADAERCRKDICRGSWGKADACPAARRPGPPAGQRQAAATPR